MQNAGTEAGQGKSGIPWGDSFKANVLAAVREAKQRKAEGEGQVIKLLPIALACNADLRTLLANQPEPGIAWQIAESNAFPYYRCVILNFIRVNTMEAGLANPGFTWEDRFELDILEAIQKAEAVAKNRDGDAKALLKHELLANANLVIMLKCQPQKGTARRMVNSGTFPRHQAVILEFIAKVTGETRYH